MTSPNSHHGVMEGRGAYNANSAMQASGAAMALPLIEKAASEIPIEDGGRPAVIADYGSSEGRNSLAPMSAAISALRRRIGPERPIIVAHIDLPGNDFNTLFDTIENAAGSYAQAGANVFPAAVGRSFYGAVLPPSYVDLGWSAFAVVWLSRIPELIPGHIHLQASTPESVRAAFAAQARADWETFLLQRSRELRRGGRLILVVPAGYEDGSHSLTALFACADLALSDMVDRGEITAGERRRMVLPGYARRPSEMREPFAGDGTFAGLALENCTFLDVEDGAWAQYKRDGDTQALAARRAGLFRATFAPTLASALDRQQPEARQAFAGALEALMRQRLMDLRVPFTQYVATLVLAKS